MSTSFYIWITVFIIIILLLSASAISKIAYDKRVRARRTLVSRQVDVETVHSGNNTVVYTIPTTPMVGHRPQRPGRTTTIYPEHRMTVTRSRTTHVTTEIDDCPPSYEQAVVAGPPQQQQQPQTRSAV